MGAFLRRGRWTLGAALACAGLGAATQAHAADAFLDGTRRVVVERTRLVATAPSRARVVLHYADGRSARAEVDGTAIVRVAPGEEEALEANGVHLVRPLMPSLGLWLAEADDGRDGIDLAAALPDAVPNLYLPRRRTADPHTPTDPRYGGQWYFQNLNMPEAWGLTLGSADTTVVVIDTGCDLGHPDLIAKLDPGRDVVDGDDDPSFEPSDSGAAHGTECAGLIGAATDNDEGIAGACPECRLRCVRMLSDQPTPLSADVEAFGFALEVDADVVSNSWGFVDPMPVPALLAQAIQEVATAGRGGKGALVLFAAGNDDRELRDDELEAIDGVICVGAINNFDESTPFTNRGNALDLVAPTGTLTTDIRGAQGSDPTDYTNLFGGTSSACPVAAGIAGLLVSIAPDRSAEELTAILLETVRPAPFAIPDANGHDPVYGYGIIDPVTALERAMASGEGGGGGEGPGATAGAGGSGAVAGTGTGGGTSSGSDGSGAASGDDANDDGCGCRAAGGEERGRQSAVLLALGLLVAWSRRR